MKKNLFLLIAAVFITYFATSCVNEFYNGPDAELPSRTVLVYLGGDDAQISSTLVAEVEAMRAGWSYTGNRCLIYIDPINDVPRLLSLRGGCEVNPIPYVDTVAVYAEENSASAEVFSRVLTDVKKLHPADSYGLIFASHSSGWLPSGTLSNPTKSIGSDGRTSEEEDKSEMELDDFAAAIPDGQFDFIIFESCLMSGVEVAYALKDKTDYILASSAELLVPGFVPIYSTALKYLFDMKMTTSESLTAFASDYYNHVIVKTGAYKSTTLSVIKTHDMTVLADRVAQIYSYSKSSDYMDISKIQHFDRPGSYGDKPAIPRYFDFMDYMGKITTSEQYAFLEALMDKIVVWKAATASFMDGYNGFSIQHHSGLTTYIEQSELEKLNQEYRQTKWYYATHK